MKRTIYIDTQQPASPVPGEQRTLGSVAIAAPAVGRVVRTVQIPTPARFEDFQQAIQGLHGILRISGKTGIVVAVEFVDDPT